MSIVKLFSKIRQGEARIRKEREVGNRGPFEGKRNFVLSDEHASPIENSELLAERKSLENGGYCSCRF